MDETDTPMGRATPPESNTPTETTTSPKLTADQSAAHEFLTELRTRISTQTLPYQHGLEARALESLWEIFGQARAAMKKYPGCQKFAAIVTEMLNVHLRPVTAKWHRAFEEGRLNSRDGADEFRGDLAAVQKQMRIFAGALQEMAYGEKGQDILTPPAISQEELGKCLAPLAYGIPAGAQLTDEKRKEINANEAREIQERRKNYRIDTSPGTDAIGLAFSGGGIRSATFCLGVTQVLAAAGLFKDVDFLSTVSGGGYTGSFLTTRLGSGVPQQEIANPRGPDPAAIRYLRHHAKYLRAADLKDAWVMVIEAIAGMLLNWTVPIFAVLTAALLVTGVRDWVDVETLWPILVALAGGLTVLAFILYGWLMRRSRGRARWGGRLLGALVALAVACGGAWVLSLGYDTLRCLLASHSVTSSVVVGLGGFIAAAPIIIRFIPILQTPTVRTIALKVLLYLAGLVVPILALLLFYASLYVGEWQVDSHASMWNLLHYMGGPYLLASAAVLLSAVIVGLLNINLTAPHRIYRDRLAKTFVQRSENDDTLVPLTEINSKNLAPYHLVNCTVNLPSSTNEALRERKSEFFLFSKHWCGSAITGYHQTNAWKMNGLPADLATAMAVSGAAASSYMGLGSMPTLTALLTLLNVRLGFWIRQPTHKRFFDAPGFLCLLREMTGIAMSEKQAWLNLSDGGHIENLAVYELLRRRCKFIICVDGEADPGFTFSGLMTLVRHAQIDFGIRLDPNLNDLRPNAKTGSSRAHAILCRIYYQGTNGEAGPIGLLLYIKLSVTGNESELIKRYRLTHPEFPHQSTLDQFFDEEQFEVYRQLGVHVAEGLFSRTLMNDKGTSSSICQWFGRLATNLLEPEEA
ncbi:MAG: hypothetical protein AB7P18_19605 [Candidatus Binatia bacterium]